MKEEDLEVALKVVIVGNGAVGKSSMIQRYCRGTFTQDYKKTIGVDFLERQIQCDGEEVRLMLWDTAGQEEFDAITKVYYRGAQACVLAFSTADRDSFLAIPSWKFKVKNECGDIPTVLVQNKIDLIDESVVEPKEAEMMGRSVGAKLIRTSVKDDANVNSVFRYLARQCLAEIRLLEQQEYLCDNSQPSIDISAFGPSVAGGGKKNKGKNNNGVIKLQPGGKQKSSKRKKNFMKTVCRTA